MKRSLRFSITCGLILILACGTVTGQDFHPRKKMRVGVLVSLTGFWSTLGQNTKAALELGAAQINQQSDAAHSGYRVELLVRDTQLVPERALEALKELDQRGVSVVIGPQSSAEVALLKPYADAHDILLISQASTASALAIAGDNVFRFCPDDTHEAEAIVALMWYQGVRTIVPFWRNDAGAGGMKASVSAAFRARGGTVLEGYGYDPETSDFGSAVGSVSSQVAQARESAAASTVAVYFAGLDRVVDIFNLAANDDTLSTTVWYGSDGTANSAALLADTVAAQFAESRQFLNPLFGLDPAYAGAWQPVAEQIGAPDAFALAAYDALFVAYGAWQQSQGGRDCERDTVPLGCTPPLRFAALKSAFVTTANAYTGVTGPTMLNSAGDRMASAFDFWAIRWFDGVLTWRVVGRYVNGEVQLLVGTVL